MIYKETKVDILDSSGAIWAKCIGLYRQQRVAKAGDIIIVTVKQAKANKRAKKGELYKALVVQTKSFIKRKAGNSVSLQNNSVVLLKREGLVPLANRLRGYVYLELRKKGFSRIISMSLGFV